MSRDIAKSTRGIGGLGAKRRAGRRAGGKASPETGISTGDVLEDTGERPKLHNGSTDGQC